MTCPRVRDHREFQHTCDAGVTQKLPTVRKLT